MEYRVNDHRRLWKFILFGVLTVGIYDLIFMWGICKDLNRVCDPYELDDNNRSPNYIVVILLSVLTLGIYYLVWWFKQGNRMQLTARHYGFEINEKGFTYLIWYLLFILGPYVSLYLFIGNLNRLATAYNYQVEHGMLLAGQKKPDLDMAYQGERELEQEGQRRGVSTEKDEAEPLTLTVNAGTIQGIAGCYAGQPISLFPGEELVIGRNSHMSHLILPDGDISRRHCSIRFSQAPDNAYYVTDYSSMGTFLNGSIRLPKGLAYRCPVGSRLSLGNGKNVFQLK